jgi:DNA-binding response OmpR family regulator
VKPFKMAELAARLKTLLRRRGNDAKVESTTFTWADLELDTDAKVLTRSGKQLNLSPTEYRLMEYFMKNPRKVLSRIQILEAVWDINFNLGTNVVDVYINYLRKKLDKEDLTHYIQTIFGMGYMLKEAE